MTDSSSAVGPADGDLTPARALLVDAFGRVSEAIPGLLDGLRPDELLSRPDPDANSIGWLVWHLARVQDLALIHI